MEDVQNYYAPKKDADRRLAAQFAVTRALAESSSLSVATPKLLEYVCEAVGWELGELWVVNAESNTLHIEGSWHVPAYEVEEFEKAGRKTILFPGIDLVGRVLSKGEAVWIDNVVDDSNFPRAPIAERVGLHGAFAFPVRVAEQINCVMAFYNREVVQPDDSPRIGLRGQSYFFERLHRNGCHRRTATGADVRAAGVGSNGPGKVHAPEPYPLPCTQGTGTG